MLAKKIPSHKLDNEIYKAINLIYSNPENKDQYGQVGVWNYAEHSMQSVLTEKAFNYLKDNKSVYAVFTTYGWRYGTYKALTINSKFYERRSNELSK